MEKRLDSLMEHVLLSFQKIYHPALYLDAIQHVQLVVFFARALAQVRSENEELAQAAAWLHDWAKYMQNQLRHHAQASAVYAQNYLARTGLWSDEEIQTIVMAIAVHSDKEKTDSPLAEVLKDADVLARWWADENEPLDPVRKARLDHALSQLNGREKQSGKVEN